ncbi:MAG: thioredoxin family protein [Planctomycetota bacterium]|jgi:glutaredoxin
MIPAKDLEAIGKKIRDLSPPLAVTFHPAAEGSAFSSALEAFSKDLAHACGSGIVLQPGDGKGLPAVPALTFQRTESGPVHYMAIPEGQELDPFREWVTAGPGDPSGLPGDLEEGLRGLESPAELLVFMASTCPHCPNAVRAANTLARIAPKITVSIIDIEPFLERAQQYKVLSVPLIVIDGELLINHVVPAETLAKKVLERGTEAYEEEVFLSWINAGNMERAVERLSDPARDPAPFVSIWRKSSLTSRMGLMLVASEALEEAPDGLARLVPGLIGALETEDVPLRGDTIDLLGQIGHPDAREPLEALLKDPNPDIVEIAEEALENLGEPD